MILWDLETNILIEIKIMLRIKFLRLFEIYTDFLLEVGRVEDEF